MHSTETLADFLHEPEAFVASPRDARIQHLLVLSPGVPTSDENYRLPLWGL